MSKPTTREEWAAEIKERIRQSTKMYHNADAEWNSNMANEYDATVTAGLTYLEWIHEAIDALASFALPEERSIHMDTVRLDWLLENMDPVELDAVTKAAPATAAEARAAIDAAIGFPTPQEGE